MVLLASGIGRLVFSWLSIQTLPDYENPLYDYGPFESKNESEHSCRTAAGSRSGSKFLY
jgi:hypothetical protein